VEAESSAVVWNSTGVEARRREGEKMEKDQNLNFYSSIDEAVGVIPLPAWR
jgi:hypothetical protein